MIGKGHADLRDLPLGGTWIGIIRKLAVIASDLEVDPRERYDLEGQDGWRPICDVGRSRSADEQVGH